ILIFLPSDHTRVTTLLVNQFDSSLRVAGSTFTFHMNELASIVEYSQTSDRLKLIRSNKSENPLERLTILLVIVGSVNSIGAAAQLQKTIDNCFSYAWQGEQHVA